MDEARLDELASLSPAAADEVAGLRRHRTASARAQILTNLGSELLRLGAAEDAHACAEEAHRLAAPPDRRGLRDRIVASLTDPSMATRGRGGLAARALQVEGHALHDLGRDDEAIEPLRFAYRWFVSRGEEPDALVAAGALVAALISADRADEADALIAEGLARAEKARDHDRIARWKQLGAVRSSWDDADIPTLEAQYVRAVERGERADAGALGLWLAGWFFRHDDRATAQRYADAAVEAYGSLRSPAMRVAGARARSMVAWCLPDDDPARLEALARSEAELRALGDDEHAAPCLDAVLVGMVHRDGWGAASVWADAHEPVGGEPVRIPATAALAELWLPQTSQERATALLRGAPDADSAPDELVQALAVRELRWGSLDEGLRLLDRAASAAPAENDLIGIDHDRAIGLLEHGRTEDGIARLEAVRERSLAAEDAVQAAGLTHELACWTGRTGARTDALRLYEEALASYAVARSAVGRTVTSCAELDCATNIAALRGEALPDGSLLLRSGGHALSWCDGACTG